MAGKPHSSRGRNVPTQRLAKTTVRSSQRFMHDVATSFSWPRSPSTSWSQSPSNPNMKSASPPCPKLRALKVHLSLQNEISGTNMARRLLLILCHHCPAAERGTCVSAGDCACALANISCDARQPRWLFPYDVSFGAFLSHPSALQRQQPPEPQLSR
jgi:hypothetical protein